MAYDEDIAALNPDHHWKFDGDATAEVGAIAGTNTGGVFTGSAIAKDATNCWTCNGTTDRVELATATTIESTNQNRKAAAGWFSTTAIQQPFCRIYGEGDNSPIFQFVLGLGNIVMFEVYDLQMTNVQIYSDRPLANNRAYHLCGVYSGNVYDNEVRFYLDGVEQLGADPTDRQPDDSTLSSRDTVGTFGDPSGGSGVAGENLVLVAPVNGNFNHWALWGDTADALLTDTEVRVELFEKGALAGETISSGTEAAMQSALDTAVASSSLPDEPCNIEIEAVTGGGDFTLDLDDVVFDDLASIHVRYNGTADTLTIRNTGTSNASIGSAPFGGSIVIATEQTITVTVKDAKTGAAIENARVLLEADTGGDLAVGTDVIGAVLTNSSGVASATFDFTNDQPVQGRVRKGSASTYYKTGSISGTITADGFDVTVLLVPDE